MVERRQRNIPVRWDAILGFLWSTMIRLEVGIGFVSVSGFWLDAFRVLNHFRMSFYLQEIVVVSFLFGLCLALVENVIDFW